MPQSKHNWIRNRVTENVRVTKNLKSLWKSSRVKQYQSRILSANLVGRDRARWGEETGNSHVMVLHIKESGVKDNRRLFSLLTTPTSQPRARTSGNPSLRNTIPYRPHIWWQHYIYANDTTVAVQTSGLVNLVLSCHNRACCSKNKAIRPGFKTLS